MRETPDSCAREFLKSVVNRTCCYREGGCVSVMASLGSSLASQQRKEENDGGNKKQADFFIRIFYDEMSEIYGSTLMMGD